MPHAQLRPRISIITGARSGIGLATAELLRSRGENAIGIDLSGCILDQAHRSAADMSRSGHPAERRRTWPRAHADYHSMLATADGRAVLTTAVPRAITNAAEPEDIAPLLAFLAGPDNRYLVRQVPFCDGGTDINMRGDSIV